jgi:AcrR family transcriptional regulator
VSGPRGPYAGTADRRASILETAWEVFAKQGYRGGSLREISARLGFSQAGMLHHFGSKQNLLLEVLQYRESLNRTDLDPSAGIGLLDQLRSVVSRNAETAGAVQLFVTMSAEATDPDHPAHQYFVDFYRRAMDVFSEALINARRDGAVSQDLDPTAVARQLIAFLDGIQLHWLITPTFDMLAAYDLFVADLRRTYAPDRRRTKSRPRPSR